MNPAMTETFCHTIYLYVGDQKLETDSPGMLEMMTEKGITEIPLSMIPKITETTLEVNFKWNADYWCEKGDTESGPGWPAHWEAHSCRVGTIKLNSHLFGGLLMGDMDYENGGFDAIFRDNIQKYLDLWIEKNADAEIYFDVSCSC